MSRQNLKSLRERLGLTQKMFCDEFGISQSLLSKIESGQTPINDALLVRVAIRHRAPEILVGHCAHCPIQLAAKEMYPHLAVTNQQLLGRQLYEDATRVLQEILAKSEEMPRPDEPDWHLRLMELDEQATRLQNYIEAFRLLIGRPP